MVCRHGRGGKEEEEQEEENRVPAEHHLILLAFSPFSLSLSFSVRAWSILEFFCRSELIKALI